MTANATASPFPRVASLKTADEFLARLSALGVADQVPFDRDLRAGPGRRWGRR
jgi:hypothetical protein